MTLFRKIAWLFDRKRKEGGLARRTRVSRRRRRREGSGNVTLLMEDTRAAWS